MENIIIIILIVLVGGFVIYQYKPELIDWIWMNRGGAIEKFADTPADDLPTGPSVANKLHEAEDRIMDAVNDIVSNYGTPPKADMDNLAHELDVTGEKLERKVLSMADPDAELSRIGGEELIAKAVKCAKGMIYKLGSPEGAQMAEGDIRLKLKPEIDDILNFNVAKNDMSVNNLITTQTDIRKRIGGDNIFQAIWKDQTGRDFMKAREVEPYMVRRKGEKVDLSRMPTNNIINVLTADNPSLFNNNQLLPNLAPKDLNEKPINMNLANIIASQNRFFEDGAHNVVRNRSGDTRPLPKALIDHIMTQGNTRDPNSLMMATKYDLIDVLETGRGEAGNEYIDLAIDTYYRANNSEFIKESEKVASHNLRKTGSLRNGRVVENNIISDLKNGKHRPEGIDNY